MSSSIATHFTIIWITILRIILVMLLKFPFAENEFVFDGIFALAAIVHVGVAQAWSKCGPRQGRVAGQVKRGRCASRYLVCTARKNARNLTVACMCRAPPSFFSQERACVFTQRLMTRRTFSTDRLANRETIPWNKCTAGDGEIPNTNKS